MKGNILKLAIFFVLAGFQPARAGVITLEDANLRVDVDGATGLFQATEKASGAVWTQLPAAGAYTIESVKQAGQGIEVRMSDPLALTMTLALSPESDLLVSLNIDPETLVGNIAFPGPLATPEGGNIVFTDSEGILIPADKPFVIGNGKTYPFYGMGGLIMSWIGVVDADLNKGYMYIIDTPADGAVRMVEADGRLAPAPVWEPSLGKFGYERRMRYHFFGDGGYVAQAKRYRDYVKANRPFSTLAERLEKRPNIAKLIGAVHIYTWDDGRTIELARELKESGIEKAWVGWDPSHPPYPPEGYDQALKELGYLAGVYDLYRDMYDDTKFGELIKTLPKLDGLWLHRYYYPGLFPGIVPIKSDGRMLEVQMSPEFNLMRYFTCDVAMVPHLNERMDKELKVYPHDSTFLDVTLAAEPFECYSPDHPATRAQDMEARQKILRFFADNYGMVIGSEWGADYGTAYTDFFHGLVTLHKFWGRSPGDLGTPTYRGDWQDIARPTMMLGEQAPTEEYLQYGLNEYWRIPLHELVFHDCAVSSWRWNDNTHKQPEDWDQKSLFEILYGTAPQWNLDRQMWEKYKDKFVRTYKKQGPWLEKIGYDEMLNHRFLTEDRKVQETTFSSGAKAIVNFGDQPYASGDIQVGPRDSLLVVPAS